MGVNALRAVYATPAESASYRQEMDLIAQGLEMQITHFGPVADLEQLGKTLTPGNPRILIFLGGTAKLLQFTQGIGQQASQRYIVAMYWLGCKSVPPSTWGAFEWTLKVSAAAAPM